MLIALACLTFFQPAQFFASRIKYCILLLIISILYEPTCHITALPASRIVKSEGGLMTDRLTPVGS